MKDTVRLQDRISKRLGMGEGECPLATYPGNVQNWTFNDMMRAVEFVWMSNSQKTRVKASLWLPKRKGVGEEKIRKLGLKYTQYYI